MQNRLRAAAAGVVSRAQRLRSGDDVGPTSHVDDDPEAEELPPVVVTDSADEELSRLDEAEAPPLEIGDTGLFDLLRRLDPTPEVPLTAPHEIGFVSLLRQLAGETDRGLLEDSRVRRVLDLVGDRLSLSVAPDGITVRGFLRRRHTPWGRVEQLTFARRYDLLRGDYVEKLIDDAKGKILPVPIPGLSWLLRRLLGGLAGWLENKIFTPEEIESMRQGAGFALTHVQRRGFDIELSGPLLLVSLLGPGLSEATEQEARLRGVDVVVVAVD